MNEIKFRFVCEDLSQQIFFLYYKIDDFIDGLSLGKIGRIEKIISKDQYTGLKDKNGVEIYKGDIIKHSDKYYIAKFDLIFGLRFIDSRGYYVIPIEPINRSQTSIEIIGNIHENPELLEN